MALPMFHLQQLMRQTVKLPMGRVYSDGN